MPTLLQLYSNHQTNKLVRTTVEYTVKQFYLMNRKPFILQMFGSVSAILDTDEDSQYGDAHKVFFVIISGVFLKLIQYLMLQHVSGGFSAHRQELKHCKHSIGYMPSLLAATASEETA